MIEGAVFYRGGLAVGEAMSRKPPGKDSAVVPLSPRLVARWARHAPHQYHQV